MKRRFSLLKRRNNFFFRRFNRSEAAFRQGIKMFRFFGLVFR